MCIEKVTFNSTFIIEYVKYVSSNLQKQWIMEHAKSGEKP